MGLPKENDLLATTLEQIMEPESKFGAQKNLLSLTFQSINILLIDHVICHTTILLKILKWHWQEWQSIALQWKKLSKNIMLNAQI